MDLRGITAILSLVSLVSLVPSCLGVSLNRKVLPPYPPKPLPLLDPFFLSIKKFKIQKSKYILYSEF
jgi:hypothetical protein